MENQEINLEKVHRLIDSLKFEANKGNTSGMLSTAQVIVAELQHISAKKNHPDYKSGCVSVVMPFAGMAETHHVPLEKAEMGSLVATGQQAAGTSMLQPPTIITETNPSEATDSHSFDVLPTQPEPTRESVAQMPATSDSATSEKSDGQELHQEPVQKELFTLQPEEEAFQAQYNSRPAPASSPLRPTDYPTSIPEDSPEIQSEGFNQNENKPVEVHETLQEVPQQVSTIPLNVTNDQSSVDPFSDNKFKEEAPINEPIASSSIQIEQTPEEKKRHMAFISDNFSTWADYGMTTEAPTLVQNQPIIKEKQADYNINLQQHNYRELNEQLAQEPQQEWAQKMQSTPIENLASAIGVNDRYLYISELFRGDESMYERSIITLNKFNNFHDAHAWSERELRLKLGWDTQNQITRQFEQLIKRRFNQAC